jgi:hypothetical protein
MFFYAMVGSLAVGALYSLSRGRSGLSYSNDGDMKKPIEVRREYSPEFNGELIAFDRKYLVDGKTGDIFVFQPQHYGGQQEALQALNRILNNCTDDKPRRFVSIVEPEPEPQPEPETGDSNVQVQSDQDSKTDSDPIRAIEQVDVGLHDHDRGQPDDQGSGDAGAEQPVSDTGNDSGKDSDTGIAKVELDTGQERDG